MKYGFLKRPKSRNWGNAHAKQRRSGTTRTTYTERQVMLAEVRLPSICKNEKDYLFANCVVLAAAIFAEPWAEAWARELLPAARQLDARRAA